MQSHCQIFVREEPEPAEALTIKICSLIMATSLISSMEQQFSAIIGEEDRRDKGDIKALCCV